MRIFDSNVFAVILVVFAFLLVLAHVALFLFNKGV
jgi:hypothetical protein